MLEAEQKGTPPLPAEVAMAASAASEAAAGALARGRHVHDDVPGDDELLASAADSGLLSMQMMRHVEKEAGSVLGDAAHAGKPPSLPPLLASIQIHRDREFLFHTRRDRDLFCHILLQGTFHAPSPSSHIPHATALTGKFLSALAVGADARWPPETPAAKIALQAHLRPASAACSCHTYSVAARVRVHVHEACAHHMAILHSCMRKCSSTSTMLISPVA